MDIYNEPSQVMDSENSIADLNLCLQKLAHAIYRDFKL